LSDLNSMKIVIPRKERVVEEQVLPWLYKKVFSLLEEDKITTTGSKVLLDDGVDDRTKEHGLVIKAKYDRIE